MSEVAEWETSLAGTWKWKRHHGGTEEGHNKPWHSTSCKDCDIQCAADRTGCETFPWMRAIDKSCLVEIAVSSPGMARKDSNWVVGERKIIMPDRVPSVCQAMLNSAPFFSFCSILNNSLILLKCYPLLGDGVAKLSCDSILCPSEHGGWVMELRLYPKSGWDACFFLPAQQAVPWRRDNLFTWNQIWLF